MVRASPTARTAALAEAVTPGPLAAVLNLKVISGTLGRFGPGDIALSKTITGTNAVTAKAGDTITAYLADGTLYRARVARFPGLTVASRNVVNAQAQAYLAQQSYADQLFLGVIVLLAAVALVNTLVLATVERRGALFLLRRVGATTDSCCR
jgi:putative ABC transport system permease protein